MPPAPRALPLVVSFLLVLAAHLPAGTLRPFAVAGMMPAPLTPSEGRTPVIFVHGWGAGNDLTFLGMKDALMMRLENDPSFRERAEVFFYSYEFDRPYPELGRAMVEDLRPFLAGRGGAAAGVQRPILVAVSAGGVLCRHAMQDREFGDRVAGLITIASPLHGALGASILFAREAFGRDLGDEHWRTVVDSRRQLEFEPNRAIIASLGFDNLGPPGPDGRPTDLLDPARLAAWGVPVNEELRRLNLEGRHNARLHVHMGVNTELETLFDQELGRRQRRALRALIGSDDADPIIPVYSGTLAHHPPARPPASVDRYPGMTHANTVFRRRMHQKVMTQIEALLGTLHEPRATALPAAPGALPAPPPGDGLLGTR